MMTTQEEQGRSYGHPLPTKFAPIAIIPSEILPADRRGLIPCQTIDGVKCHVKIVGTAHLQTKRTAEQLDDDCRYVYNRPFEFVLGVWKQRLRHDIKWWDRVVMKEIEPEEF